MTAPTRSGMPATHGIIEDAKLVIAERCAYRIGQRDAKAGKDADPGPYEFPSTAEQRAYRRGHRRIIRDRQKAEKAKP